MSSNDQVISCDKLSKLMGGQNKVFARGWISTPPKVSYCINCDLHPADHDLGIWCKDCVASILTPKVFYCTNCDLHPADHGLAIWCKDCVTSIRPTSNIPRI